MEIKVENFEKICRTCFSEKALIPISHSTFQDGIPVADVLTDFILPMDLKNAQLPQQICSICINHLNLYYNFKNVCSQNEVLLKSCLEKFIIKTENSEKEILDVANSYDTCDLGNNLYSSTDDDLPLIDRVDKCTETKRRKVIKSSVKREKGKLRENAVNNPNEGKFYTCEQCNKSFPFKYKLAMHVRVHTKEKPYTCNECSLSFSLKGNLKRHKMIHSGEKPHNCQLCGKGFIQATSLQMHTRQHHRKDSSRCNLTCKICSRVFVRLVPYNMHLKKHHPEVLEEPLATKHEELKIEVPKVRYTCHVCGREFDKLIFLKRHESRHGEKKFLCSDCGKGFVRKADLQSHFKVHTGEKPFKCSVCTKSFAHMGSLVTHSLVHSGYKPYSCYICSKSFTQLSHLKVHQRTHNGERPYSCPFCGKTFALNSNLTVHIRTHTGETPYICAICGRGFHDSSSMKKHKSSHLNVRENDVKVMDKSDTCQAISA